MPHPALAPAQRDADVERLDEIIAALRRVSQNTDDLLIEHLLSARTYLLGAMPDEYAASLRDAAESLGLIPDQALRQRVEGALCELLSDLDHTRMPRNDGLRRRPRLADPDPEPADLFTFLKAPQTSLGVFYPWHYIIASFPTFEDAQAAANVLRQDGFGSDEVLAVPGEEMLKFLEGLQAQTGALGTVMEHLSRGFATEAAFAEADRRRAREGAGFLAIHAPAESETPRIVELTGPFQPVAMHWYTTGGIQSLI